mmetsp:Transcript_26391/g.51147  ORF Transcript_26391/g.51147 Transcript_26391/m.51147 type:complete len:137 (+) Transcript_26391:53-463(+)
MTRGSTPHVKSENVSGKREKFVTKPVPKKIHPATRGFADLTGIKSLLTAYLGGSNKTKAVNQVVSDLEAQDTTNVLHCLKLGETKNPESSGPAGTPIEMKEETNNIEVEVASTVNLPTISSAPPVLEAGCVGLISK